MLWLWFSFLTGVAGLIFIILKGFHGLLINKKAFFEKSIAIPFIGIALILLPIPFFFMQSFVSLGDITLASVIAAFVTLILPFGILVGIWREVGLLKNKKKKNEL